MLTTMERSALKLSAPVASAVGLGLAIAMLTPLAFLSQLAAFQFLAVQIGFIGAVYFGFSVADGRIWPVLIEFPVAGLFTFAGAIALWADSPVFLAAAYAAHAA